MHFVMSGAVNGGRYYGEVSILADDGPEDIGQGRLVPTMPVEQNAATMASWFCAADSTMKTVLPNIANFNQRIIGLILPNVLDRIDHLTISAGGYSGDQTLVIIRD